MQTLEVLYTISVIIIAIQVFVILLVPGVIFALLNRGVWEIPKYIRRYAPIVQDRARLVATKTEESSLKVAEPIIQVEGFGSRLGRMWRRIF